MNLLLFTRRLGKFGFPLHQSLAHRLQFLALSAFIPLLQIIPRRCRATLGAFIGQVVYFIGVRKQVTIQNLKRAFPSMPPSALNNTSLRIYRHFGRVATAFVDLKRLKPEVIGKWLYINGFDVLDSALKQGKGAIVFSGHLGNWEIMGAIAAKCGYPVTFVVASQSNTLVEDMIDRFRKSVGIEIVKRRDAVRGVLSALKRNRLVAILIDQDAHEEGAFVPFFGQLASTPRGPAVFHLRTGSPLIFARSERLPQDRYQIEFSAFPSIPDENAEEITARMTAELEAAICKTPEQWFWMHRRWKTPPPKS